MASERHGALVVFGSGPGIGVHVASRFARGGFEKVILLSRDAARLRDDAFIVYSNAPQVEISTVSANLVRAADVQRALRRIAEILGDTPIECIHYNAAKASRTLLLEESSVDLRANLEVSIAHEKISPSSSKSVLIYNVRSLLSASILSSSGRSHDYYSSQVPNHTNLPFSSPAAG